MYSYGKQTRELKTDQGLPLDASQAVSAASFSLEQPVYRSIDIQMAPSIASAHSLSEGPRSAYIDVSPAKSRMMKAPAVVVTDFAATTVVFPSVDSIMEPLERTHFEVCGKPAAVVADVLDFLQAQTIIAEMIGENEFSCSKSCDESFASTTFHIRLLLKDVDKHVMEFQRRSGCCRLFNSIFRSAKGRWHQCSTQRKPMMMVAPPLRSGLCSPPVAGTGAVSDQWGCIVNWMQNDALEAMRTIAALAAAGAVVPDQIMSLLVNQLSSSEHRVEALHAITAAIPSHRLEGFEDAICSVLRGALSSDLILQRAACKFVAKVAAELPHVLQRDSCNFTSELAAVAQSSKWACTRQFAESSLSALQPCATVY